MNNTTRFTRCFRSLSIVINANFQVYIWLVSFSLRNFFEGLAYEWWKWILNQYLISASFLIVCTLFRIPCYFPKWFLRLSIWWISWLYICKSLKLFSGSNSNWVMGFSVSLYEISTTSKYHNRHLKKHY